MRSLSVSDYRPSAIHFSVASQKIVAAMHQALVRRAQMRCILAHADLVRDDTAGIAFRRQEPGVIEVGAVPGA